MHSRRSEFWRGVTSGFMRMPFQTLTLMLLTLMLVSACIVERRVMADFVGREQYLEVLEGELERVRGTGEGRFVSMRGRRRVGKSRLVEEFLRRQEVPHVFFTASRQTS